MTGMLSFDNESRALTLCNDRAALIAKNIANSNTPNYKAQDINFQEAMKQASGNVTMKATNPNHLHSASEFSGQLYYRVPMQTKMDNNTVDDEIERKNFVENSMRYQAGIGFVEKKASLIIKALRGE